MSMNSLWWTMNIKVRECLWVSVSILKPRSWSAQLSPKHSLTLSNPSLPLVLQVLGDSISGQASSLYFQSVTLYFSWVSLCNPLWGLNLDPCQKDSQGLISLLLGIPWVQWDLWTWYLPRCPQGGPALLPLQYSLSLLMSRGGICKKIMAAFLRPASYSKLSSSQ